MNVTQPSLTSLLFATLPLGAQENTLDPNTASNPELPLTEILNQGGIMMIPLAALALVTLILVAFYLMTIRRGSVVTGRFMKNAEDALRSHDNQNLLTFSHRRSELVARVTQRILQFMNDQPQASLVEIREVAESEGSRQASIFSQRITWLGDIGAIAPMVGLLGTVIGMIKSFYQIAQGNFEGVRQMQLASGVSEALVTTATGLCIGIVAMIFHSFFRSRVNRYLTEFEVASTHIMSLVTTQFHARQQAIVAQPSTQSSGQHPTHKVVAHPQSAE